MGILLLVVYMDTASEIYPNTPCADFFKGTYLHFLSFLHTEI